LGFAARQASSSSDDSSRRWLCMELSSRRWLCKVYAWFTPTSRSPNSMAARPLWLCCEMQSLHGSRQLERSQSFESRA
jgi:hypothetical protein